MFGKRQRQFFHFPIFKFELEMPSPVPGIAEMLERLVAEQQGPFFLCTEPCASHEVSDATAKEKRAVPQGPKVSQGSPPKINTNRNKDPAKPRDTRQQKVETTG